MRDGKVERRRTKERDPTIVVFDQYAFDLTRLAPAPQVNVGLREKYVWELAFPAADDPVFRLSPGQFRVELHERLFAPLYPLAFGVIAFAILGFPRTTRQSGAVSMSAVIAALATLRLGGFARTPIPLTTPAMLAGVFPPVLAPVRACGFLILCGVSRHLLLKTPSRVPSR